MREITILKIDTTIDGFLIDEVQIIGDYTDRTDYKIVKLKANGYRRALTKEFLTDIKITIQLDK